MSRTFALLPVSSSAYVEIAAALRRAGYDHAFVQEDRGEAIDMHGIALIETVNPQHQDETRER